MGGVPCAKEVNNNWGFLGAEVDALAVEATAHPRLRAEAVGLSTAVRSTYETFNDYLFEEIKNDKPLVQSFITLAFKSGERAAEVRRWRDELYDHGVCRECGEYERAIKYAFILRSWRDEMVNALEVVIRRGLVAEGYEVPPESTP